MKHKLTLCLILSILGAISVARAQTPTYSFAAYTKHGQSYFDATIVAHQKILRGRLSVAAEFLAGIDATDPAANVGGMVDLNYDFGNGYSIFAGPAYTSNLSTLSVKNFDSQNIVLAIGIRSHVDWRTFFGGNSSK